MMKICPGCERRRTLGNCHFGGPNAVIKPHCRACCSAPDRDRWKADPVKKTAAAASARR